MGERNTWHYKRQNNAESSYLFDELQNDVIDMRTTRQIVWDNDATVTTRKKQLEIERRQYEI